MRRLEGLADEQHAAAPDISRPEDQATFQSIVRRIQLTDGARHASKVGGGSLAGELNECKLPSELCTHITIEELNFILRQDLASFIERSFYELHPGQSLELAPHIELIASMLDAVRHGQIKRLIINMPPRHLKSHCVSVAFVAWMLGHEPSKHIICASYGQDLANEMAALTRKLMLSPFYRALFGSILGGRQAVDDFGTVFGGRRLATSVGGVLTGAAPT